ncbi:MAG: hypothetical protein ACPG4T_13390 [Nannocystaceae bacterium]
MNRFFPAFSTVLAGLLCATGCESTTQLPLKLVFPEDTTDLQRADNAALVVFPDGLNVSVPVEGTSFSLEVELEPDGITRVVDLYLADGDDLLAWGRSPEFVLSGGDSDLTMFVGRPGALSTYPGTIDAADPKLLAAHAEGRGFVMLGQNGETYLLNQRTLEVESGETFRPDGEFPNPDDGALLPDAGGGVVRVVWAEGLAAWRYDPGVDQWSELTLVGDDVDLTLPRPGAAHLQNTPRTRVLLFGGGEYDRIASLDLIAEEGTPADQRRVSLIPNVVLDGPRQGARANWLIRERDGVEEWIVLAGGSDAQLPGVLAIPSIGGDPVAIGPVGDWQQVRCEQVDVDATKDSSARMICAGGSRDNTATAAGGVLVFAPQTPPSILWDEDLLPLAMEDPMWFHDDGGIYAQGDGHLIAFDRKTLTPVDQPTPAGRTRGGHSVNLSTGATFLLGGETQDGGAVDHWHVFMPALL